MPGANYDLGKTVKKFFTGLAYAGIPFVISYLIQFLETETFPLEYAGVITLSIAILHAVSNAAKHWKD